MITYAILNKSISQPLRALEHGCRSVFRKIITGKEYDYYSDQQLKTDATGHLGRGAVSY